MAQYLLLLRESATKAHAISPAQMQQIIDRYRQWAIGLRQQNKLLSSNKLADAPGKVLRKDGDRVAVKDGPYGETKDLVSGYFLIEAADEAEATTIAMTCPHVEYGGPIELRPIEPT